MGCCNSQTDCISVKNSRILYSDFIRHRNETELKCDIKSMNEILAIWRIGRSAGSQSPGGVMTLELTATKNNINEGIIKHYQCVFHYGPENGNPYSSCYHYYKYSVGHWKIVRCIDQDTNQTYLALRLIATKNSLLEYADSNLGHVIEHKQDIGCDFLGCDKFEKRKQNENDKKEELMFDFLPKDFRLLKHFIVPNCRIMLEKKLANIEWNVYGDCYLMLQYVLKEYEIDIIDIYGIIIDYVINIKLEKNEDHNEDHWDSHDYFWKLEKANFTHEYFENNI